MTNWMHNYVYYYNPLHVSSNIVLIIRRSNCINTASGIVFSISDRPVCRLRRNNNNNNNNNSESFRKYVSNIPGKHEVKELQKTAILCTAHILRKVLM